MHHYKDWVSCFPKGTKQELAALLHLQVGPCDPTSSLCEIIGLAKLELLALKWVVTEKLRDYLLGSKFTVYTNNNPLAYVKENK